MPRPGVDISIVDGSPPGAAALDTGTAFMFGKTERGPVDKATKIASVKQYAEVYGDRSGGSLLYDSVSAYFSEGGGSLYVGRVGGTGLATATATLGTSLKADAASPGAWGNDLKVETVAPTTFSEQIHAPRAVVPSVIVVKLDDVAVDRSPVVGTPQEAVDWSQNRPYVRLSIAAAGDMPPAGTSVSLAGGADSTSSGDTDIAAALALFEYGLGPGQVLGPGYTTQAVHEAILGHCNATHRCGLLDLADSSDPLTLGAAVEALRGVAGVRFAAAFAPWAIYPGEVSPTTVVVPYSAVEAGIIARVDRAGNPNAPAAGADGVSQLAVGLSQTYTDEQRQALNALGVDLAKEIYGDVRTYGYRTAAGPDEPNWLWYGNSRTLMAIAFECDSVAETYVLKQIDGRGQIFSRLNKDLAGVCARYYDMNALYGETPGDAFYVDTGPGVNTDETIANGEIHATVKVKTSPAAEWVVIEIVKVPVERPVAA